jgi:hypothetical protein
VARDEKGRRPITGAIMPLTPSTNNERYFMPLNRTPRRCVWRPDADLSDLEKLDEYGQCTGFVNPAFRFTGCCDMHTAAWQRLGGRKDARLALIAAAEVDE